MQINSIDDCLKLQCDLDSFVTFFEKLVLSLNLAKYKFMTINRIRFPLMFSYCLRDSKISRCDGSWSQAFQ